MERSATARSRQFRAPADRQPARRCRRCRRRRRHCHPETSVDRFGRKCRLATRNSCADPSCEVTRNTLPRGATPELRPGSNQRIPRCGRPPHQSRANGAISAWRAAKNRHCAAMTANETETRAKAGAVIIPVTLFEQNCTLIWCEATKKAVVIDPGGDVPKILAAIKQSNVTCREDLADPWPYRPCRRRRRIARRAQGRRSRARISTTSTCSTMWSTSGARFGMTGVRNFAPDRWLSEGDQVSIGELTFDILHCPGHSPGSVVFFNKELRFRPCRRRPVQRLGRTHRSARRRSCHADQVDHRKAVAARRRCRLHLRPRRRLQHRPGADDQSVSHRRGVVIAT